MAHNYIPHVQHITGHRSSADEARPQAIYLDEVLHTITNHLNISKDYDTSLATEKKIP